MLYIYLLILYVLVCISRIIENSTNLIFLSFEIVMDCMITYLLVAQIRILIIIKTTIIFFTAYVTMLDWFQYYIKYPKIDLLKKNYFKLKINNYKYM